MRLLLPQVAILLVGQQITLYGEYCHLDLTRGQSAELSVYFWASYAAGKVTWTAAAFFVSGETVVYACSPINVAARGEES